MRLQITFAIKKESQLDINYQHYLSALCYGLISRNAPRFAQALHEGTQWHNENRSFKYFTFSQLYGGPGTTEYQKGHLVFHTEKLRWTFDSAHPAITSVVSNGLLQVEKIRIGTLEAHVADIHNVEDPDFSHGILNCTCLSPVVSSVYDDKMGHRYLAPTDPAFWEGLAVNALRKWQALFGDPVPESPRFLPDMDYLTRHKKTSKLIRFKEREIIIGHLIPFAIEAHPPLLSLLYHGGIGSRNALGFGMIGATTQRTSGLRSRSEATKTQYHDKA